MSLDAAVVSTLSRISTATLTTVLLKKGLRHVWMRGPRPLRPDQPRLVGPAFTLRFVPAREDLATPASWASPRSTRAAIEAMPKGCVAVVDAMGTTDAGILPGHGETPVPERSYSIEDLSQQLAAVLAREGVARTHLAGISLGGLVAQHFAAANPTLVDRLVLIDTTPRYVDEMRRMWVERARAARTAGVPSLIDGLLKIGFTDGFLAEDPPAVRYVRDRFAKASGEGYALACEALGAADLRPLAASIEAPTLVICGSDELPPFQDAARWLQQNIRGARLVWLSPARHASILEQPNEFVRHVRAFLA